MQTTEDVYKQLQAHMPTTRRVAEPVPASVTLVWRTGDGGALEIFLVQRAKTMRFLPGFWAFPGGKQDPEDESPEHAGARELEEETGIAVHPEALQPVGRWITPPESPLRYDTRYFLVELPEEQVPDIRRSEGELIDSMWCPPSVALEKFREGTLLMSSPVVRMLGALLPGLDDGVLARAEQAARDEEAAPRLWDLIGGIAVSPLETPTLPPATRTNCYVIGSGDFVVIDPATPHPGEQDVLFRALDARIASGGVFREVWLTHHHGDHIGAAAAVAERYEVPIAAHRTTAELLSGRVGVTRHLEDGDRLVLPGHRPRELECIFTPGHAPGHLCFFEHATGSLVAGDMVASDGTILIDPSEGDMSQYLASLERMRSLQPRLLLPAHGFAMSDPDATLRHYIDHRLGREAKVIAALGANPRTTSELVKTVYADTPEFLHGLAERSLISHLIKLQAEGRARKIQTELADAWAGA